ncbi:PilZ domain-containing protein [bacterium]|nr:PilZ domain-containing protein [bacterium]
MVDMRRRPRKNTPHLVRALDDESGQVMGRIVDITCNGMMLVTGRSVPLGRRFQVRLNLPVMVHNRSDINVEAEAVWCNQDKNPSFYRVGFKFINLAGEDGYLLEEVMHKFSLVG